MIDLYTFATPNGRKASIALEELGLAYRVHVVDITKGEQFEPEFLAINPNNKIPAIVDSDGPGGRAITIFESGAILIYLAEKTGRLLPATGPDRYDVLQWVMFQMGGVGPMFGQYNHFARFAREKIPYAIERYTQESKRLLQVLERQLQTRMFVAREYSIADILLFPWVDSLAKNAPQVLEDAPRVRRWLDMLWARPAVQRGMQVPEHPSQ
jgi:GSH-dependent disulfide-bond oxidoreductase